MTMHFGTNEIISISDVFDGRLERFEVREHVKAGETSDDFRCLTFRALSNVYGPGCLYRAGSRRNCGA